MPGYLVGLYKALDSGYYKHRRHACSYFAIDGVLVDPQDSVEETAGRVSRG